MVITGTGGGKSAFYPDLTHSSSTGLYGRGGRVRKRASATLQALSGHLPALDTTEGRRWASTLRPAGEELDNGSIEMYRGVAEILEAHVHKNESEKEVALTFHPRTITRMSMRAQFRRFLQPRDGTLPRIRARKTSPKIISP